MTDAVFFSLLGGLALPMMFVSWRAFWCNLRQFRHARSVAPLDGLDLSTAAIVPPGVPTRWPVVEEVDDPQVAAAYASLADDRALNGTMYGELFLVFGSALMGVTLPALRELSRAWLLIPSLLAVLVGVALRLRATRRWATVSVRYAERYAVLTALPPVTAPRARSGWFGRR